MQLQGPLSTAVCVEPAIRSLKNKLGENWQIFVSGDHADLYHFHPAVTGYAGSGASIDADQYCHCYSVRSIPAEKADQVDPVCAGFMYLGIEPVKDRPQLHFGDEDAVRLLEMGVLNTPHPRVGFSPGLDSEIKGLDSETWNALGEILRDTVGAGLVQLSGNEKIEHTLDISQQAQSARDIATVVQACDVVIGETNGVAHLAAATETPRVILYGHGSPSFYDHGGQAAAVDITGLKGRDLLAAVIDSVVDLVGNTEQNDKQ